MQIVLNAMYVVFISKKKLKLIFCLHKYLILNFSSNCTIMGASLFSENVRFLFFFNMWIREVVWSFYTIENCRILWFWQFFNFLICLISFGKYYLNFLMFHLLFVYYLAFNPLFLNWTLFRNEIHRNDSSFVLHHNSNWMMCFSFLIIILK